MCAVALSVVHLSGLGGLPTAPAGAASLLELAFVDPDLQIARIRADGTGLRQVTSGSAQNATPVWSPDGWRLVFVSARGLWSQIYAMDPTTGISEALTRPPGSAVLPAWSPDRRRIAFMSTASGTRQVSIMAADGGGRRRLTSGPGESTAPVWSPGGRHIAFISRRDHPDWELYAMRADGSAQTRLTRGGVLLRPGVVQPAWLPDGRRIAFVARVGRAEQGIFTVPLAGGPPIRLTTGYAPSWSSGGRRVAFVVARVGDAQIYVMDGDGRNARRLISGGVNLQPAWSPDGRLIAFLSSRNGDLALWVMRVDGTGQRRLAAIAGDLSALPLFSWRPVTSR